MSNTKKSQKKQTLAVTDTAAAAMQVASAVPAYVLESKAVRRDKRAVVARAPSAFMELVVAMAEDGGGNVAGVSIDATATRDAMAKAARLRVGAAAARAVARYLEQEALDLASGFAQRALSATTSLEALARTPEGRSYAAKAAELRAAARSAHRRVGSKRAKAAADTTTTPSNGAAVVKPTVVASPAS